MTATHTRVPITLLTGFLGSGKTTLLNRLMAARPETRGTLAIIVNEFGEIGIDGDLLPAGMTRQVELPGGCICCVLSEDLDKTICELLDTNDNIDSIVIETTGVAEPLPISWTLAREPLSERVRLAAVVTVVDALELEKSRPLSVAVDAQIEYADILVVSKLDLVVNRPSALPEAIKATLDQLNPTALRMFGTAAEIVSTLWQALCDPDLPRIESEQTQSTVPAVNGITSDRSDHQHNHRSRHGFDTVWLPIDNTIDFEELTNELEELPANYVRIKGVALVIDESTGSSEPRWVAFHRVGTRVSCEPLPNPARPRMVALGSGIEKKRLAACLDAAVVPCKEQETR